MQQKNNIEPKVIVYDRYFEQFDISEYSQQITINKAVDSPVHSMVIVLNPSMSGKLQTTITHNKILAYLQTKIKKNQIISVKIDSKGKKHNFLGFIDHKYESVRSDNNNNNRTLIINCSLLLPKLLIRDNIVNSPQLTVSQKAKEAFGERIQFFGWMRGLTEDGTTPFAGKPEEAVKWILENMPGTNTNVGNEMQPKTFFDPKKKDYKGNSLLDFTFLNGEYLFSPNLARYSGPVLNYIQQAIDSQFYEVFFDTTTGEDGLAYNKMIIRPKPFSLKDYNNPIKNTNVDNWVNFEDLETVQINSDERLSENLGTNDYELKNFFTLNFANSLIGSASSYLGKFGLQFPVVYLESIKRYGLRDLAMTSNLINTDSLIENYNKGLENNGEAFKTIDQLTIEENNNNINYLLSKREKAVEWNAFPHFESGQIDIVANNDVTIGKVLDYTDKLYYNEWNGETLKGVQYYINAVTESFSYGNYYTQHLRVTRGAPSGVAAAYLNAVRSGFLSIDTLEEVIEESDKRAVEDSEIYNKRQDRVSKLFMVEKAQL